MTRTRTSLLVLAMLLFASPSAFAEPLNAESADDATPLRRGVATAAAIVPGVLVHGTGHFVRGEARTGRRLLYAELIGIGGMAAGLSGLLFTGAAPELISPSIWFALHGFGLFGTSFLADIYGSLNNGPGTGAAVVRAPRLQFDAGYIWINNPAFDYRNFAQLGAQWAFRSFIADARGWAAVDDDNQRLLTTFRWRIVGPRPDREAADGTHLDWRTGVAWHRHGTQDFSSLIGETALQGRLDLQRVGPTLRGAFAEAEVGVAAGLTQHTRHPGELDTYLLGGFGSGVYLGHAEDGWGEFAIYYDHRHDGFVGGAKVRGIGSGAIGHFGMRLQKSVIGPWGFELNAAAGGSLLMGVSVLYRMGGSR